ncbi:MAG: hypothetical protein FWG15_04560 [Propionibacteriaceae bacterium]|jgi:hypothetical protein|nr:hypothetical protein [Propionibacteriaceae bacterium]
MARVAYSYLGAILAGLMTMMTLVVVWPITAALPVCKNDPGGYCSHILTMYVGLGAIVGFLFLTAHLLRLGWQWALWMIGLTLVVAQLIIDLSAPSWGWFLVVIPLLGALATYGLSDAPAPRPLAIGRLVGLGVIFTQFIVWLAILLTGKN